MCVAHRPNLAQTCSRIIDAHLTSDEVFNDFTIIWKASADQEVRDWEVASSIFEPQTQNTAARNARSVTREANICAGIAHWVFHIFSGYLG
jgi:hypothetical protein